MRTLEKIQEVLGRETEEAIRDAIMEVDNIFPWRDTNEYYEYNNLVAPSINQIGRAENQFNNWGGRSTELCVWFTLKPGVHYVRKSQLYAYEKYLEKLAEELAGKKDELGFTSVRSVFRTGSTKKFK